MPSDSSDPVSVIPRAVIEAESVEKTFRIPTNRVDTLKERVIHPFTKGEFRDLKALRGISFDVRAGEFFGIVGRNGSGKSTLLKILASIYSADQGEVRVSGQVAPFIELGVGFNHDLTARENVILNSVMVGLSQREAERRLRSVIEFAELEDFVDLKLKNYSSGMLVRLGFSVMLGSDAPIMLIDEVLAVGDAAFQEKCIDAFHQMRDAGRTIVFVTHDMSQVERFCDRALLLRNGKVDLLGDPEEVAVRYRKLVFEEGIPTGGDREAGDAAAAFEPAANLRVVDAWLQSGGRRCESAEYGEELELHVTLEGLRQIVEPSFALMVSSEDGVDVFGFGTGLGEEGRELLDSGEQVHVSARFPNLLASGHYAVKCWVTRNGNSENLAFHSPHVLDFRVYGAEHVSGVVSLEGEVVARKVEIGVEAG